MFVQRNTAGSERDDQQQTANDGSRLEEIIFQKISCRFVVRNGPPTVEVNIQNGQPEDKNQGRQFGLVADGDAEHEHTADHILDKLPEVELKSKQRGKHQDEKNAGDQLHVRRMFVFHLWKSGHQSFVFLSYEQQQQSTAQGNVFEQKANVPEDAVGKYLRVCVKKTPRVNQSVNQSINRCINEIHVALPARRRWKTKVHKPEEVAVSTRPWPSRPAGRSDCTGRTVRQANSRSPNLRSCNLAVHSTEGTCESHLR